MEERLSRFFITLCAFIALNGIITSSAKATSSFSSSDFSHSPKINGTPKASKSIHKAPGTLDICLDESCNTLFFNNLSDDEMAYSIYDEDGNLIVQGTALEAGYTLSLATFPAGQYTLTVIYGGVTYNGTFELYK